MNSSQPNAHDLFEILVRENSRMLMAYLRSATHDSATADDVWQETMLVAWRRIDEFDRSRPFGRVMLGYGRKQAHTIQVDDSTLEYLDSRFESLQSLRGDTLDEKLQALRDCVASLPEHYRTCIEMRFIEGVKPSELSKQIGLAIESVKKRLLRAKGMLVTCIDQKMVTE